jgi:MOSC domain-containing protein YiiM
MEDGLNGQDASVVGLSVGDAETIQVGRRTVETGIRKGPVARVEIGPLGVAGDVVADRRHHGGPDQAVYVYSASDLGWWASELGRPLVAGAFGENLTLSSFGPEPVRIGDRFRAGPVLLEATAPRVPCGIFAAHMAERAWVRRFAEAGRTGFYARVISPGPVAVGDPVEVLGGGEQHPEIATLLDASLDPAPPRETLDALLASPLSERARAMCLRKLSRS